MRPLAHFNSIPCSMNKFATFTLWLLVRVEFIDSINVIVLRSHFSLSFYLSLLCPSNVPAAQIVYAVRVCECARAGGEILASVLSIIRFCSSFYYTLTEWVAMEPHSAHMIRAMCMFPLLVNNINHVPMPAGQQSVNQLAIYFGVRRVTKNENRKRSDKKKTFRLLLSTSDEFVQSNTTH